MLTATVSPVAPPKKWFLTLYAHSYGNYDASYKAALAEKDDVGIQMSGLVVLVYVLVLSALSGDLK